MERSGMMPGQPPRIIVDRFLPDLTDRSADAAALISHVGYGIVAGSVFGLVRAPVASAPVLGVLYGLGLYAVGYEGWVPMARVLPPAHRDDLGRVITMLSAHLVFGFVLGRLCVRRR